VGQGAGLRSGDPVSFDDFWSAYPRKVAKGQARKAWERAVRKASPQDIISGISRYTASLAAQKASTGWAPEFCHPATWLNGERWADEGPKVNEFPDTDARLAHTRADAIRRGIRSTAWSDAYVRSLIRAGLVTREEAERAGYLI